MNQSSGYVVKLDARILCRTNFDTIIGGGYVRERSGNYLLDAGDMRPFPTVFIEHNFVQIKRIGR
jgi:hypothetical protein